MMAILGLGPFDATGAGFRSLAIGAAEGFLPLGWDENVFLNFANIAGVSWIQFGNKF